MSVAVKIISESELAVVFKEWRNSYPDEFPEDFKKILWECGMNIYKPFEKQENIIHRNEFNKVVQCDRWVGVERIDSPWLQSGHASRKAKNNGSGSRMVKELDPENYLKF